MRRTMCYADNIQQQKYGYQASSPGPSRPVNLGKSIERPASRSAGHLISLVDDVVHARRNALILHAELHYMTNALLNSMSKSVSTDGSVLRNTGVHLMWNLARQNTAAAGSELAGNKLVRMQNICVACL